MSTHNPPLQKLTPASVKYSRLNWSFLKLLQVEANIIRISHDDNDVFAALTVDSFCVKNNADKKDEDREANEDLWTQVINYSPLLMIFA